MKRFVTAGGYVPGMSPHQELNWFTGTPDYILDCGCGMKAVVEVKTHWYPTTELAKPIATVKDIPLKYWLQVQSYMEILNLDYGILWSWTLYNGYSQFLMYRTKDFWNDWIKGRIILFRNME
jgi:hypothetical protein